MFSQQWTWCDFYWTAWYHNPNGHTLCCYKTVYVPCFCSAILVDVWWNSVFSSQLSWLASKHMLLSWKWLFRKYQNCFNVYLLRSLIIISAGHMKVRIHTLWTCVNSKLDLLWTLVIALSSMKHTVSETECVSTFRCKERKVPTRVCTHTRWSKFYCQTLESCWGKNFEQKVQVSRWKVPKIKSLYLRN